MHHASRRKPQRPRRQLAAWARRAQLGLTLVGVFARSFRRTRGRSGAVGLPRLWRRSGPLYRRVDDVWPRKTGLATAELRRRPLLLEAGACLGRALLLNVTLRLQALAGDGVALLLEHLLLLEARALVDFTLLLDRPLLLETRALVDIALLLLARPLLLETRAVLGVTLLLEALLRLETLSRLGIAPLLDTTLLLEALARDALAGLPFGAARIVQAVEWPIEAIRLAVAAGDERALGGPVPVASRIPPVGVLPARIEAFVVEPPPKVLPCVHRPERGAGSPGPPAVHTESDHARDGAPHRSRCHG